MGYKAIVAAALAASLSFAPADPVRADAGDAIAGAIIGGLIGSAITKENQRNKAAAPQKSSKSSKSSSGQSSAQREQNRQVQTALNYFGYPVGTPDGALGPKSRAAISAYQATLGYPATGQLTEYERTLLLTAHQRGMAGGAAVAQTIASHPMGVQGLLVVQRDEMAGVAPVPVLPVAPAPAPAGSVMAGAGLPALMPEAAPALPSFMGSAAPQVSLASQCNKVSLMTNTNGGYTTAAAMTDPVFALSEQFCLARTYAMAAGEDLAAGAVGFSPAQIAQQCAGFGSVLKEQVTSLSLKPYDQVMQDMAAFVLKSGMAPAQLSGTAKVCLGVGYTTDAMDVALGSALLLTALGETGYAELLGHHLSQGFGTTVRPDLALGWYELGLSAMATGKAVFAPGLTDRPEVIRKAAFTLVGRGGEVQPATAAGLPVFALAPSGTAPDLAALPESAPDRSAPEPAEAAPVALAERPAAGGSTAPMAAQIVSTAAWLPLMLFNR